MQAKPRHTIPPSLFHPPDQNLRPPCNVNYRPTNVSLSQFVSLLTSDYSQSPTSDPSSSDKTVAFWDYQSLFTSQRLEAHTPIKLRLLDGALPAGFPSGTYYLAGPGLFSDDYGSTVHPLDGHGYLRAFKLDGPEGEVKFGARYVRTEARVEEWDPGSGSWRFTHRGPFSVLKGGRKLGNMKVMKNVANTSILVWGGRLFCLWEGGNPYEIHPQSLDTIGSCSFVEDGQGDRQRGRHPWDAVAQLLKPILYGVFKMPPKRLLSHYKVDTRRGRLIILACNAEDMLLPHSHFTFCEFDVNFNLIQKREFNISDHLMIHDWAFTDTHYIIFGNRVKLNSLGSMAAISGLAPMISALSVNHSKPTSPIYVLPRFQTTKSSTSHDWRNPIEAPQLWLLHVANAFEEVDDDGRLKIQIHATACAYKLFNFQSMFGYNWQSHILDPSIMNGKGSEKEHLLPHLVKVSIELNKNDRHQNNFSSITHLRKQSKSRCLDFPVINPRYSGYKHRYIYAAASSGTDKTLQNFPFDTVVKWDTLDGKQRTWSPGNRTFIGEPVFVPRAPTSPAEDDGYLVVVEYVAWKRRCNLVVLDARRVGEEGAVVARFEVPKYLTFPLGFHGTWASKH